MKKYDINKTNIFNEIIRQRHTSKQFSEEIISDDIIMGILNCLLTTPTSFGIKPWKILIIKDKDIQKEFIKLSNYQNQVSQCSHLIVLLSWKGNLFAKNHPWMIDRMKKVRNLATDQAYDDFYQNNFFPYMKNNQNWDEWSIRQTYLLLQTLLLTTTAYGVDACPMEGIDSQAIIKFLEIKKIIKEDEEDYFLCSLIVALGYSSLINNKQINPNNNINHQLFAYISNSKK